MTDVNSTIARLMQLENRLDADELAVEKASAEIVNALSHPNARVARRAAAICQNHGSAALVPELLAAYQRFLKDPIKTDPGCEAKLAIIEALRSIDYTDLDFYTAAFEYHQHEPIWGGSTDTAAEVRAIAAMVLVRLGTPNMALKLVDLLNDAEPAARAGAIRALAGSGLIEAQPLLRMKCYVGDERGEVMGECFGALMAIDADNAFRLIAGQLENEDRDIRNEAALALGESRHPSAFGKLSAVFKRTDEPEELRAIALAIALIRSDEAVEFLVGQIDEKFEERSVAAIIALSSCRELDIDSKVREAVRTCNHRYIARVFNEEFGV